MNHEQKTYFKEPLLESFLRSQRIKQLFPYISRYPNCRLLDVGCGWEDRLLQYTYLPKSPRAWELI